MNFNLALNTILYIMIFIFPGILFRKFLFIRHDSKQFYHGHLFERFALTILTSITLLVSSFFIYQIIIELGLTFLSSISYTTLKSIFDTFSGNKLPKENELSNISDYVILLGFIYVLSCVLGYLLHFVLNTKIFKKFGIFKRNNYWEDLFKRDFNNKVENSFTLALADVLVETNSQPKLYSGRVEDYYISPSTGELQTIVLSKVTRYKKKEDTVENKSIPGHFFILDNKKVLNINLTYVYQKKEENRFFKTIINLVNIVFAILLVLLVSILFTNHIEHLNISKKIILGVFGVLSLASLNQLIIVFLLKFNSIQTVTFVPVIMFSIPFLWVFNLLSGWQTILLSVFVLAFISTILKENKKEI